MARFWQKRDVDDPKTSASFAELVGDPERLRCLYVHTFCDARGTSSDLWNSYKDTLHTTLYRNTLERLRLGAEVEANFEEKRKMTEQELIAKRIPGISDDEIAAHFSLLPDRYFILTDASEITLHIQMVNKLLKSITATDSVGSLRPVIDWKDDLNRSLTVVNVVTWDRAGLFYKLAGAFSVAGLNILGAKVISRTDHIAIDTFYVVEPGRGVVQNAAAQESFAKIIESALISNTDLYPEILAQAKKIAATRYLYSKGGETLHSSFPPTVDVYHEISMQRTIVEVQARDQIGLLYRLAKAIFDFGFDITFARIGTERGVAIDTFYIESANHEPVEDPDRLQRLRTRADRGDHPGAGAGRGDRLRPPAAPAGPARIIPCAGAPRLHHSVGMTEEAELKALHAISSLASGTDDPAVATRAILAVAARALRRGQRHRRLPEPRVGQAGDRGRARPPAGRGPLVRPGPGHPGLGRPGTASPPSWPTPPADLRSRGPMRPDTRCEMAAPHADLGRQRARRPRARPRRAGHLRRRRPRGPGPPGRGGGAGPAAASGSCATSRARRASSRR